MLAPRVATTSVELIVRASRMWKFTIVWIPTAPRLRVQRRPGVSVLRVSSLETTTAMVVLPLTAVRTASAAAVTISRSTVQVVAVEQVTASVLMAERATIIT